MVKQIVLVKTIPVVYSPWGIAVNPDSNMIYVTSDVCCCCKALTEEIQIVDAKRIMIRDNTNLSYLWLKVLMYLTRGHYLYRGL
jgi:DNA-binding beta-propeller fold protein YncE